MAAALKSFSIPNMGPPCMGGVYSQLQNKPAFSVLQTDSHKQDPVTKLKSRETDKVSSDLKMPPLLFVGHPNNINSSEKAGIHPKKLWSYSSTLSKDMLCVHMHIKDPRKYCSADNSTCHRESINVPNSTQSILPTVYHGMDNNVNFFSHSENVARLEYHHSSNLPKASDGVIFPHKSVSTSSCGLATDKTTNAVVFGSTNASHTDAMVPTDLSIVHFSNSEDLCQKVPLSVDCKSPVCPANHWDQTKKSSFPGKIHNKPFNLIPLQDERNTHYSTRPCFSCEVCGEAASGNFFGANVCLPCKSFFIRCTKNSECCILRQCRGNCNINKRLRNRCQFCRYQRCLMVGMTRKEKPESIQVQDGQELCRVCGDISNGVHFGIFTCEGCKKFYRRGLKEHSTFVCKKRGRCRITPRNRNTCRLCRYQKCISVGMSRTAIKMGRPRKLFARWDFDGTSSNRLRSSHLIDGDYNMWRDTSHQARRHDMKRVLSYGDDKITPSSKRNRSTSNCTQYAHFYNPGNVYLFYHGETIQHGSYRVQTHLVDGFNPMNSNRTESPHIVMSQLNEYTSQGNYNADNLCTIGSCHLDPSCYKESPKVTRVIKYQRRVHHTCHKKLSKPGTLLPCCSLGTLENQDLQLNMDAPDSSKAVPPLISVKSETKVKFQELSQNDTSPLKIPDSKKKCMAFSSKQNFDSCGNQQSVHNSKLQELEFRNMSHLQSLVSTPAPITPSCPNHLMINDTDMFVKKETGRFVENERLSQTISNFPLIGHKPTEVEPPRPSFKIEKDNDLKNQSSHLSVKRKAQMLDNDLLQNNCKKYRLYPEAKDVGVELDGSDKSISEKFRSPPPSPLHSTNTKNIGYEPYTNVENFQAINKLFASEEILDNNFEHFHYSLQKVSRFWESLAKEFEMPEQDGSKWDKQFESWLHHIEAAYTAQLQICERGLHVSSDSEVMPKQETWPPEDHDEEHWRQLQERIAQQAFAETRFVLDLANGFLPTNNAKLTLSSSLFGNTILMASREWFDPKLKHFRVFWNWNLPSRHLLGPFQVKIVSLGKHIFELNMDVSEVALLSALNVTNPSNVELQKNEQSVKFSKILLALLTRHLQSIGVCPTKRIPEILSVMASVRHMSMWFSSLIKNMRADPSSLDKTLHKLSHIAFRTCAAETRTDETFVSDIHG